MTPRRSFLFGLLWLLSASLVFAEPPDTVSDDSESIHLSTPTIEAAVRKKGYVTAIAAGSLLDRKNGFREPGFGLEIVDWIIESGSDADWRDQASRRSALQIRRPLSRQHAEAQRGRPADLHAGEGTRAADHPRRGLRGGANELALQARRARKKAGSVWTQNRVFPAPPN